MIEEWNYVEDSTLRRTTRRVHRVMGHGSKLSPRWAGCVWFAEIVVRVFLNGLIKQLVCPSLSMKNY